MVSTYEAANRQRKVVAVVARIETALPDVSSAEIADVLRLATDDEWEAVASHSEVNLLSEATKAAVVAHFDALAKVLVPSDPFAGLG